MAQITATQNRHGCYGRISAARMTRSDYAAARPPQLTPNPRHQMRHGRTTCSCQLCPPFCHPGSRMSVAAPDQHHEGSLLPPSRTPPPPPPDRAIDQRRPDCRRCARTAPHHQSPSPPEMPGTEVGENRRRTRTIGHFNCATRAHGNAHTVERFPARPSCRGRTTGSHPEACQRGKKRAA